MGWTRGRTYAVVGLIALGGLTLAVLPASGDSSPPSVSLHLSPAGQFFEYGTTKQTLTTSRCEINERNGPLFTINRKAGLDSFGMGYKTGGAQGTPCGRVEFGESLELAIFDSASTTDPLEGLMFSGMRLDLELKKNAWVVVDLYRAGTKTETYQLATGASIATSTFPNPSDTNLDGGYTVTSDKDSRDVSCASPSDSGPDSGANDNCLWTITAAEPFNRIVITTKVGEVSLEGGGDYASGRTYDTLFELTPTLTCDNDTPFEGDGEPTYTVRPEAGGANCVKGFTYQAGTDENGNPFVELVTSGAGDVVYLELLELQPQTFGGEDQIPSLYYDDDLTDGVQETLAQFCLLDPRRVDANGDPLFDLADDYDSAGAESDLVLPTGETTCIISAEFVTTGTDESGNPLVKAIVNLYNRNDGFRTFK